MIEKLPDTTQNFINEYLNLPLGGKKVRCPYYINTKKFRQRMGLRVLIGKGTPEEIKTESLIYEKLRKVNFNEMSSKEIRDFLIKCRIGIDCSGFVSHILDNLLTSQTKKHIWKYLKWPKMNLYKTIARILRPIENISAWMLTNDENSYKIKDLNNIHPGDLIRSVGLEDQSYHVMIIIEVLRENGKIKSFKYANSTRWYKDQNGVRIGEVIITNPSDYLVDQNWTDEYKGCNWTYEEIQKNIQYAQVRRLKKVQFKIKIEN